MAILSSLLGGTATPVGMPQQISTTELPEELKPYYKDILGKAQALYEQRIEKGFEPFEGPTIAKFTPEQEEAFTGIAGLQGKVAPQFEEARLFTKGAAAPITIEDVQGAMSPYQQTVVDIDKREAQRDFEQTVLPNIRAQQVAQGAFGGTRGSLLEAQTLANQSRLLSDIQARGSQAAFQQAQAAVEAQRMRAGQAGTQLANIAPTALRTGLAELGAQQAVGEERQRQAQTSLDEAYRQYQQEREFPYTTMGRYQQVVAGAPMGSTTYASPPAPTPGLGQQLVGGLAGLGSLYGTFTGKPIFGQQAKTGGGIAGLVKRRTGSQVEEKEWTPVDLPSIEGLATDPYTDYNYEALERGGLAATREAVRRRQEALQRMGDLTQEQIALKTQYQQDPRFTREQNLYGSIMNAAFSPGVTEAGSGVGKVLTGLAQTGAEFKEREDKDKAKRLQTGMDINELKMSLLDAQSRGDMETVQVLTKQISDMVAGDVARTTAQSKLVANDLNRMKLKELTPTNHKAIAEAAGGQLGFTAKFDDNDNLTSFGSSASGQPMTADQSRKITANYARMIAIYNNTLKGKDFLNPTTGEYEEREGSNLQSHAQALTDALHIGSSLEVKEDNTTASNSDIKADTPTRVDTEAISNILGVKPLTVTEEEER